MTRAKALPAIRVDKLYYDGMLIKAEDYRYEIAEVGGRWFIVNQSGSIQSRNTEYKEDGDTLIDCSDKSVVFENSEGCNE